MGTQTINKQIADGAGTAVGDLVFLERVPATVVADVAAGTAEVEYSTDKESDLRNDPVTGRTWLPWDFGTVTAGTPGVNALIAPVTALRMLPSGGIGTLKITF